MKRSRWWIRSALVALLLGLASAVALAAGCGTPPDNSGDWLFIDDVALNMRRVAQGPVAYGTYSTVARYANYGSTTMEDVSLSWTGRATTTYSASLKAWAGSSDSSKTQTLRVKFDLPPMREARLLVRQASQYDFFQFDAGCIWLNTETSAKRTAIADYGVKGRVQRAWNESTLTFRSVY